MARKFTCRAAGMSDCDFAIEDEDEDELVEMAQRHARDQHDKDISRQDVLNASKEESSRREKKAQR